MMQMVHCLAKELVFQVGKQMDTDQHCHSHIHSALWHQPGRLGAHIGRQIDCIRLGSTHMAPTHMMHRPQLVGHLALGLVGQLAHYLGHLWCLGHC